MALEMVCRTKSQRACLLTPCTETLHRLLGQLYQCRAYFSDFTELQNNILIIDDSPMLEKPSKLKDLYLNQKSLQTFVNMPGLPKEKFDTLMQLLGVQGRKQFHDQYGELIAILKKIQNAEDLLKTLLKHPWVSTIDSFLSELAEAGESRARKHKKLHKMVQVFFNEDDEEYERFHEEQAELAEPEFEDVPEDEVDEKARELKYREVMIEGI